MVTESPCVNCCSRQRVCLFGVYLKYRLSQEQRRLTSEIWGSWKASLASALSLYVPCLSNRSAIISLQSTSEALNSFGFSCRQTLDEIVTLYHSIAHTAIMSDDDDFMQESDPEQ